MKGQMLSIYKAGVSQDLEKGLRVNFIVYVDDVGILCGLFHKETNSIKVTASKAVDKQDEVEILEYVANTLSTCSLFEEVHDFICFNEIVLSKRYGVRKPIYVDDLILVYEGTEDNIITCDGEVLSCVFVFEPINLTKGG